jgi:hypothetical protein
MAGQNQIVDVEIPDNRPLHDIVSQLVHMLGFANMEEVAVSEIEMIEAHAATPTSVTLAQTALAADIRDGAWLIAHCVRRTPQAQGTVLMPNVLPAPSIATEGPAITFQKRALSNDRLKKEDNT